MRNCYNEVAVVQLYIDKSTPGKNENKAGNHNQHQEGKGE